MKNKTNNSNCENITIRLPKGNPPFDNYNVTEVFDSLNNNLEKKIKPHIGYSECPLPFKMHETVIQIIVDYTNKEKALDLYNKIFSDFGSMGMWGNYEVFGNKLYINLVAETVVMKFFIMFIKQSPRYSSFNVTNLGTVIKSTDALPFSNKIGGGKPSGSILEIRWFSYNSGDSSDNGNNCYFIVDTDFFALFYKILGDQSLNIDSASKDEKKSWW